MSSTLVSAGPTQGVQAKEKVNPSASATSVNWACWAMGRKGITEINKAFTISAEKRNQMFTPEQKLQLVRTAVADLPNVEAELWPGLLADFAVRHHASAIVRGVRNTTDFDVEYQMALINRGIHPELETLLLPASAAYQHFSSSMAREMIRYHQPLEKYLPASIVPLVREMTEKKEG